MAAVVRKDPYLSFRFIIEIDGIVNGGFAECSGLQVETETEDYREGGLNEYTHKLSKGTKYQNIILKRGITDSDALWQWHQDVTAGKIKGARRSISIILMDEEQNEKWRWLVEKAYPVKWAGPALKSDSSTIAFETLELVHTGIRKI